MANRYYQDNNPARGTGKEEGIRPTQKKGTKAPSEHPPIKIEGQSDIVSKADMGLGNKASRKQKIGQSSHD